ncbi:MAG: hypothetical protein BM485_03695 [Desulfobulbaceae bacterium DB1]|nr:MAG: hypothetical protein BM485_03695 [Desulfobulbaceae bacterium DB1]
MATSTPYPARHALRPPFLVLLLTAWLIAVAGGSSWAATIYGGKWQQLETRHAVLLFESREVLDLFAGKIRYDRRRDPAAHLLVPSDETGDNGITEKIDALFMRVQEILDMRRKMEKVTIKIYPDTGSLRDVYQRLFRSKDAMRAWYLYEKNTIYVTVADVHEGMLAHEMAHAIIDHFFSVRPPSATAEILARYVDKHLTR